MTGQKLGVILDRGQGDGPVPFFELRNVSSYDCQLVIGERLWVVRRQGTGNLTQREALASLFIPWYQLIQGALMKPPIASAHKSRRCHTDVDRAFSPT